MFDIMIRLRPEKILDIGCGAGVNLPLSKIFSSEFHAVDYAEKTVAAAKRYYPDVNFNVMDAFNLKYPDSTFDVSIISSVLILYENEDDRVKLLKEAARVTANNADSIVVAVVWKDSFLLKLCVLLSRYLAKWRKISLPEDFMGVHFTEKEAQAMFSQAGLRVEQAYHTGSLYGFLESMRYLFMCKYQRTFGKSESEAYRQNSQNIFADCWTTCFPSSEYQTAPLFRKGIFFTMFHASRIFPSLFEMFSVYVLKKHN